MKRKKISQKLSLNKKTISNLDVFRLEQVKGGATYKCPTDFLICDTYADCTYTEDLDCTMFNCTTGASVFC